MWILLVLLAAFFVSLQDVFGKKIIDRVDPHVVAWAWFFFSLPLLIICLFVTKIPPLDFLFWKTLIVSTVILVFASIFYFKAIKYSDLSIAVPMLAFTPLFLLITSPVMLGEFPSPLGIFGIALVVAGSYVLHLKDRRKGFWEPFKSLIREKGSRYMLMVAALFSISANLDKIGVIHSSPIVWIFSLNFLLSIALWGIMLKRTVNVRQQVKGAWPFLAAVGLCNGIALIFQMAAIQMTLVPYLIAVKRTSVFITSLFGFFLFKEKGMRERLVGIVMMVFGVMVISFFQ